MPYDREGRISDERSSMPGRRSEDKWAIWDKRLRDAVLFVIGAAGIINELFLVPEPRVSSFVFLTSLVGLPFVLQADERRRKDTDDG